MTIQFTLDKPILLWLMKQLINLTGVKKNEKESDKFQQYEEEQNPRLSGQDVHQRGQAGHKQETCEG